MRERAERLPGAFVSVVDEQEQLEADFAGRVAESSTLAFRVAYSVLRHRQDAEDVAQDAFAKAYRSFRQLRDRERFRAWLVRMTWRLALDRRRGDRRRQSREAVAEPDAAHGRAAHDARLRQAQLWEAIDRLPDKLRVVIVLAAIEGHELREVAGLLRLPEGTVKSRLFLARRRLKELLQ